MPVTRLLPHESQGRGRRNVPRSGPFAAIVIAAILVAGGLCYLSSRIPLPLVLPVASILLLTGAGAIALLAWLRPHGDAAQPNYWDVTGALTFAGIGAALLSEPEAVIPLLEGHWPVSGNDN